jgi:hypothetical protein
MKFRNPENGPISSDGTRTSRQVLIMLQQQQSIVVLDASADILYSFFWI